MSRWFNPRPFAAPPAGQFGNAGRNIRRGPAFAQFDAALHKDFAVAERQKTTARVEAYGLYNQRNFGVPSHGQSSPSLGDNGDAVFKDTSGDFAPDACQVLTAVGAEGQIQLAGRYMLKGTGHILNGSSS